MFEFLCETKIKTMVPGRGNNFVFTVVYKRLCTYSGLVGFGQPSNSWKVYQYLTFCFECRLYFSSSGAWWGGTWKSCVGIKQTYSFLVFSKAFRTVSKIHKYTSNWTIFNEPWIRIFYAALTIFFAKLSARFACDVRLWRCDKFAYTHLSTWISD